MFRTLKKPINILPFIESFQIRQNINQLSAQLKKKKSIHMILLLTSGGIRACCYHQKCSLVLPFIVTAYGGGMNQLEGCINLALIPSLPHIHMSSRANGLG